MIKYQITPNVIYTPDNINYKFLILLLDFVHWAKNINECVDWMKTTFQGKYDHQGMTILIELESDLILFCLKYPN